MRALQPLLLYCCILQFACQKFRIALEPLLQSMVQNVSDEEDDTWGIWTAQGNSQQAPSQAPTTFLRRTEQIVSDEEDDTWGKWTAQGNSQQVPSQAPTTCLRRVELDSRERSNRIARWVQVFLDSGYKCFSQARCLAESTIDNHNWLQESELDKIKAECKNKCCNSRTDELHYHEPQKCPDSSRSATSSAIHGSVNTAIPEAATKHSLTRRLLTLANENPRSSEAATEHSKIPEAACQEAKRLRKSGKGTGSHARTPSPDPEEVAG